MAAYDELHEAWTVRHNGIFICAVQGGPLTERDHGKEMAQHIASLLNGSPKKYAPEQQGNHSPEEYIRLSRNFKL